ncbi:MAG: hypothetical protein MZU84_08360 [Sphingobacterium sp.]|nr:hypothetical protein [Sphingobacterium sp.]
MGWAPGPWRKRSSTRGLRASTSVTVTSPGTGYYAPLVLITDPTGTGADVTATLVGPFTGGLHKFVDRIAGLDPGDPNGLGQYIPVAVPDVDAFPGSDYYEIRARAIFRAAPYRHAADPPARLPSDQHRRSRAERFPLSGPAHHRPEEPPGPHQVHEQPSDGCRRRPLHTGRHDPHGCGRRPHRRGILHREPRRRSSPRRLHLLDQRRHAPPVGRSGGGDDQLHAQGVSVFNVPDMPDPGDGSLTLFYGNEQSARLMFYHDHALGLTRLNVYAGEAAGYVITDAVEQDLINGTNSTGVNPGLQKVLPDIGFPLIIQDKTFVDPATIYAQDPTWNWGIARRRTPVTRRSVDAARLHAQPESLRSQRHERLRPVALRPLVLAADDRISPYPPVPNPYFGPGSLGGADDARGPEPLHGHGGLHGHAARQRHRLSLHGSGAEDLSASAS